MDGKLWPAYILHSRPFQEDKLLLQLLLPEQGRLTAVIRRRNGKLHRALQPFQLFAVALTGRSSLLTVTQLEEQAPANILLGKVLFSGLYINELICRLWPTDLASETLFAHYQQVLTLLVAAQQQSAAIEPCLRQFEFALLAELGVLPDWQYDAWQQPIQSTRFYRYVADQGFIPIASDLTAAEQCTTQADPHWQGQQLLAVANGAWHCQSTLFAAKQLSRLFLSPLLGNKPLASRALFSQPVKVKPTSASS